MPWTPEQVKEYVDRLFAEREKFDSERDRRYMELSSATERALKLARKSQRAAAEALRVSLIQYKADANEWGGAVRDLANTRVSNKELDSLIKSFRAQTMAIIALGVTILIGVIAFLR